MGPEERSRYISVVMEHEWRKAWGDADHECELIVNDMSERGVLQSGSTISRRRTARLAAVQRILDRRLGVEEEVLEAEGQIAPAQWADMLLDDVVELLNKSAKTIEGKLIHDVQTFLGARDHASVTTKLTAEMGRLQGHYLREIELLRGRRVLKAEVRAREVHPKMASVTINVGQGTVGTLNVGTIIGEIQTNLTILKTAGYDELVDALKRLTEAVGNADALGDQRRDALEQVAALSAEAEKPVEQRRVGVVKAIALTLGTTLGTVADLKSVWDVAWPPIKAFFGL